MKSVEQLRVWIFADGAELSGIQELARQPWIKGFTTNPTLTRKACITAVTGQCINVDCGVMPQ